MMDMKKMTKRSLLAVAAMATLVAMAPAVAATTMETELELGDVELDHKIVICHIPPGNPAIAHTIEIDLHALDAHLAHGDVIGPCDVDDEEANDDVDDDMDEPGDDTGDDGGDEPGDDTGDDGGDGMESLCVDLMAQTQGDGSIAVSASGLMSSAVLLRSTASAADEMVAELDSTTELYTDVDTSVGVTYTYSLIVDGELCDSVEVTAIPVFPSALAAALAVAGTLVGYFGVRRFL
jgi:hypothetical protein